MPQNQIAKSKIAAVIVAAGRGERAGGMQDGPKQYREIGKKPVITYTLEGFLNHPNISQIMIVAHPDDDQLIHKALSNLDQSRILTCHGGATRQASVYNGLLALEKIKPDYVMIHDAVRPFLTTELITRIIAELEHGVNAVLPAISVTDTLKRTNDQQIIENTVSRDNLYAAQTPQSFQFMKIIEAHQKAADAGLQNFTDDCAIAEWAGIPVHIIQGNGMNTKLTTKEDIVMANAKLSTNLPDVRTGNGYDVHQLIDGDHVTLCGIDIPHNKTLSGHSDADVALHALTDALLATCGAGDIGDHFPPSDPQWKGAASYIFLEKAVEIVHLHGGTIMNADVSLIAEQPKIGPHRQVMRENLAKILDIDVIRCSVKATTNERIGFIGREEGIAAIATATVVYGGTA
ncbi:bifunctional 2-C-methyl-D-erythritol 4-phosphate cytidylyltransferase/2-C-methyl-D-erythritol 2,4-cyclodiphosphate synthase [Lentilitoribacter sp. Alg239-R112]|uniref:bifunctional 2-C-methyl-D-erythritol 4-phosphate cytidylyltransferase/2-C-methyl-D-erythritol 2,4-cyclodiphosphate synthase n=1 Tax=Lentilitoribacter sp. Alg239-R112 TaxID=2305987 RepID=UPI0013A6D417|nr:bifunctional 2-C-methyl-D-erythritol 4-phosphate cytidylyltransferase/2-C-methyl-D-erythritol 2,4-cyclodiphosphate synthase [Lentilitoribacter sp. Alg239-R112]